MTIETCYKCKHIINSELGYFNWMEHAYCVACWDQIKRTKLYDN